MVSLISMLHRLLKPTTCQAFHDLLLITGSSEVVYVSQDFRAFLHKEAYILSLNSTLQHESPRNFWDHSLKSYIYSVLNFKKEAHNVHNGQRRSDDSTILLTKLMITSSTAKDNKISWKCRCLVGSFLYC